jgi:hypothetical protein
MYGVLSLIAFFVAAGTPDLTLASVAGLVGFGLGFLSLREMQTMGFFYNELEEADK